VLSAKRQRLEPGEEGQSLEPEAVKDQIEGTPKNDLTVMSSGEVGDCLLSDYDLPTTTHRQTGAHDTSEFGTFSNRLHLSDQLLNYHHSNDQDDQLDLIEEEINVKVKSIKDLKELNKVQQMTDEQIFNSDIC
jgi:hypothetical protein